MTGDYGGEHQAVRRANLPYAYGAPCGRCGRPMLAGQPLDLDHNDDRVGYRGFAHARCNRSAGGKVGRARQLTRRTAKGWAKTMLTEVVLGVEISEDRRHTSIAAAGWSDEFVLIELAAYVDGTDAVDAVLALRDERTVTAVVVDPRSQAATTIKPLVDAGIAVTEPTTNDIVVATGEFTDAVVGGRLRHSGQPVLDTAVRYGTQRALGGAAAWERRGAPVDVSPLTAATLAAWGLHHAKGQMFFGAWR